MSTIRQRGSPCSTAQQKPLNKPLKRTLNINSGSVKVRKLSEKQEVLAEDWAGQLIKVYPNEHYSYQLILKDCKDFLLTSQTDEEWAAIGNGLPNPRTL